MTTALDFYVFAGPNGSGKSSFVAEYLKKRRSLSYYCADEISGEPTFQAIADEDQRNYQAMLETEARVYAAMENRMAVAYETVLSSDYKWLILDKARALGYQITAIFVTTENPQINLARVQQRVQAGGHPVPPEKTLARYEKSMQRLGRLLTYATEALVFDNSVDNADAVPVLYKHDKMILINGECQWVIERIKVWRESSPEESRGYQFQTI